ncbi:NAD-dependent epimerase/dehydratase family protein [Nocardia paucivorans]|uniref:NAD-dependent epimerase/dehydratase family protein n=1 Tax=Nocardia paucivorans TaxID=114259 RepID=UPI0002D281CE|nr:NAD-dependent epimerase/dehydratase family protein [Nocardia paucivorans]
MRIFLAGATGVIGSRLLPLLVAAGHQVAGTTLSPDRAEAIRAAGGVPVVCDVYDLDALTSAMVVFAPDLVIHQITALPDDPARLMTSAVAVARMLTEGTANLISAAKAAGAQRFLAWSTVLSLPGSGDILAGHENAVLEMGGVVVRYGHLYGPGTYYQGEPPAPPRIHVDEAAARIASLLEAPSGIVVLVEESAG